MASHPAAHEAIEILSAARRWAQSRRKLRQVLDSKRATPRQQEAARKGYRKATDELESYIARLERILELTGSNVSMEKRAKKSVTIPWAQILGAVSVGAKAVQEAIENKPPQIKSVIDTEGE